MVIADNTKISVKYAGDIDLCMKNSTATLKNVEYVPDLCANLVSASQMAQKGNRNVFEFFLSNI